ncbi:hypothetical protein DFH08DRAFT_801188 [Mycena albidolilacea]|uniref:NTF2 domain-containing protein n=1 Tax=Mycena albidolilacea TaxID=1033008 RepID=A0AAD7F0Q2_9AGAR|nr:hypothetical protein DFH08DRAFT_801188 [Mycena albidolilacea]
MATSAPRAVNPSEVGWQFVPQYYTFVNKQPDRLHQFYTKKSTFIHGTEGDDGKPCLGQQEIHQRITSIGFQDCKVFIHSVDAQSSADGGIIIQVIGEMSNHADPWRKFVQTFFLAEQPNGYFVLNDIFRFLKEETVESDDATSDAAESEPVSSVEHAATVPEVVAAPREPTPPPPPVVEREPTPPPAAVEEAPAAPDVSEPPKPLTPEPPAAAAPSAPATPQPNGIHRAATPAAASTPAEKPATPSPAPPPAAAAPTPPPAAAPTPPPAAAAAPAQPAAPAAPKTWANLAAANSKKWGSAVAQDSRGTTEVAPSPTPTPAPTATSAPARGGHQQGGSQHGAQGGHGQQQSGAQGQHPNMTAALNVTTPQCFVKGVIEPITVAALTAHLTTTFGPLKDLEIVRSKACAFFEFLSLDAARRAIAASLPNSQGGEGGVWVDCGEGVGTLRISIETRKERGDRPVSRPRGGAPLGEGRGGGGGGEGRGRGEGFRGGRGRGGARGAPGGGK